MACLLVCLVVAVGGVLANWARGGLPRVAIEDVPWVGEGRAPFLIAGSILMSQSLVGCIFTYVLRNMQELAGYVSSRFSDAMRLYTWMSFVTASIYLSLYCGSGHVVVSGGDHLLARSGLWTLSTPVQWLVFGHVCTRATEGDMVPIYVHTVMIQVFGALMHFVGDVALRWFCFVAAASCLVQSFRYAFRLSPSKDMGGVSEQLRLVMLVVWAGFPVVVLLRRCGYLSAWQEQVLLLTVLDVLSKGVTFSALLLSRVFTGLARVNGTVQVALASQDMMIEVNTTWQLLQCEAASSAVATSFREGVCRDAKFTDFCASKEDCDKLLEAAFHADNQQLASPTPRVAVNLHMPGGGKCGKVLAELLVAKCSHGRRVIGVVLADQAILSPTAKALHPFKEDALAADLLQAR